MSGGMGGGEAGVDVEMLTTKGDTHGFDTDNARVPIGADTQIMTADSAQALGLAWKTPTFAGLGANTFTGKQTMPLLDVITSTLNGTIGVEIGNTNVASTTAQTHLDLKVNGADFNTRLIRLAGTNGNFTIDNVGTGNIHLKDSDVQINAGKKFYLDNGGTTYIYESIPNKISMVVQAAEQATIENQYMNTSNVRPLVDNQWDLGTATYQYRNASLSGNLLINNVESAKMQLLSSSSLSDAWTSAIVDLSAYTFSDYSEFQIYIDGTTQSATQELRLNAKSGGSGTASLYTNSIWWDAGGTQTINGGAFNYWTLADTGANGVFTHTGTEWKYKVSVYPNYTDNSIRWLSWEGLIGTNVPAESMLVGQGHNATSTGQNSTFEFYPSASTFGVGKLEVYGVLK